MITNIFHLATVFLIAVYLMVLQEMRHQKKKKSLEDRIAGLQDAILSKQRDYTAKKEEVSKLIQVRERLEKDLETAHRLGKQWQEDFEEQRRIRLKLGGELQEKEAVIETQKDGLRIAIQNLNRMLASMDKLGELQDKERNQRTQISELQRLEQESAKRELALDLKCDELEKKVQQQKVQIQRLMRENFSLKSKAEIQNAETERQNRHLTVELDRAEEDYHNLLVLSQDYLRRMKLPEIRVEEYTRLAEARQKSKEPDLTHVVFASQDGLDPAVSDDKTADLRF